MNRPQDKIPLQFQSDKINYFIVILGSVIICSMGIIFYVNFVNDPTVPPIVILLAPITLVLVGLLVCIYFLIKLQNQLLIEQESLTFKTLRQSRRFIWTEINTLEITFNKNISTVDTVSAILDTLSSATPGGVKVSLTSGDEWVKLSFIRVSPRTLQAAIQAINDVTQKKGEEDRQLTNANWKWDFQ
jgi:hypothetical protein